jgi:uncharacterized protein
MRRGAVIAAGVGGTGLLGASLSAPPGSRRFYLLTLGLAGTWAAGAAASGRRAPGRPPARRTGLARDAAGAVLTGAATFGAFYRAARLARHIAPLDRAVRGVLRYADDGSAPLVLLTASVNAVAEELFFRGALWALAEDSRPLVATTLAYAGATTATRNPALVLAGAATSVVFGLQRRHSGGVLAPALSHLTWSLLMLRYLPPLFLNGDQTADPTEAS